MASEIFYKPMKALCPDGTVRSVRVKCHRFDGSMAADTFFTVPAHVYVRRRYVHGYVTGLDDEGSAEGITLQFRPHLVCANAFAEPI